MVDVEGRSRLPRTPADERLTLAIEAARLGTWTWDMASATTTWDPRLEELHGMPPGGFGGTFEDWVAALHPDDRSTCLAVVEAALENPRPYVLLHRTIWPDGSLHFVECRGTVLTDHDGRATGTTGVAIDVTDRERQKSASSEALARERRFVDVLQQTLLPTRPPEVPGTHVAARYITAQSASPVGGDWYAVLPFPDGRIGLAIGDVAGHGLTAVAHMASARFSLRALGLMQPNAPEQVLDQLSQVVQVFMKGVMITAVFGVLDLAAHTWTFANAGHCPVLVRGPNRDTKWLDTYRDPPLGVAGTFQRQHATVEPGSTLVFYTDGLIERRNESIEAGLERLRRACEQGPQSHDELCEHLAHALLRDARPHDDIAILVVGID